MPFAWVKSFFKGHPGSSDAQKQEDFITWARGAATTCVNSESEALLTPERGWSAWPTSDEEFVKHPKVTNYHRDPYVFRLCYNPPRWIRDNAPTLKAHPEEVPAFQIPHGIEHPW